MAGNDLLNSLKGMLGDNADEKINAVMGMLKGNSALEGISQGVQNVDNDIKTDGNGGPVSIADNFQAPISAEGLEYLGKIKSIIDEMGSTNDPRSNLLMSLRPYMRETRQRSIDNAVKILNLSRFSGLFKI